MREIQIKRGRYERRNWRTRKREERKPGLRGERQSRRETETNAAGEQRPESKCKLKGDRKQRTQKNGVPEVSRPRDSHTYTCIECVYKPRVIHSMCTQRTPYFCLRYIHYGIYRNAPKCLTLLLVIMECPFSATVEWLVSYV